MVHFKSVELHTMSTSRMGCFIWINALVASDFELLQKQYLWQEIRTPVHRQEIYKYILFILSWTLPALWLTEL